MSASSAAAEYVKLGEQWAVDRSRRIEAILAYEAALKIDPACEPAKRALAAARGRAPTASELAGLQPTVDWYAYDRARIHAWALACIENGDKGRARILIDLLRAAGADVKEPDWDPKPPPPPPKHVMPWDRAMTEDLRKQERELLLGWIRQAQQGARDHRDAFTKLGEIWQKVGDRQRAILAFSIVDTEAARAALAKLFEYPEPSLVPGEINPLTDWSAFDATMKALDAGALFRAFMCLAHADQRPKAIVAPNGRPRILTLLLARDYWKDGNAQKALSFYEMLAIAGALDDEGSRDLEKLRHEVT